MNVTSVFMSFVPAVISKAIRESIQGRITMNVVNVERHSVQGPPLLDIIAFILGKNHTSAMIVEKPSGRAHI